MTAGDSSRWLHMTPMIKGFRVTVIDFMGCPFFIVPALNYQKQSYKVNVKEEKGALCFIYKGGIVAVNGEDF
jgi:hypothetical protein